MSDTTYQILQDGRAYKVWIKRLGELGREADGFASRADAASWIAEDKRFTTVDEEKEPMNSAHLRVVR
jgi:hypothetical protein